MKIPPEIQTRLKKQMRFNEQFLGPQAIDLAVKQRIQKLELGDAQKYWDLLNVTEKEWDRLVDEIVVNETWFLRDEKPFEYLAQQVRQRTGFRPVRILSAACSTGEEPYSMAIALLEAGIGGNGASIEAIDISAKAIDIARGRLYSRHSFRGSSRPDPKYFETTADGHFRVCDEVASMVNFRCANLLDPELAKQRARFDFVFCRNVLIYLEDEARRQILNTLESLLLDDGLFFVGHADPGALSRERFNAVGPSNAFVFSKVKAVAPLKPVPIALKPLAKSVPPPRNLTPARKPAAPLPPGPVRMPDLAEIGELANGGKLSEAADGCLKYLAGSPASVEGWFLLAVIRLAQQNVREAEQTLHKVIYLDPKHGEAMLHLVHLHERQKNSEEAERWKRRLARVTELRKR